VALVDVQVTVALCPNVMVDGDTLSVTAGGFPGGGVAAFTTSAAAPFPTPPAPVQFSEYAKPPAATGVTDSVPLVAREPVHAESAVQPVALVDDHVSVAL
jgi:hypothetical protein